jgi:chemotaxis protein MotA
MSIGTVLGFVVGLALFLLSIVLATDNYWIFVSLPSAIMVFGGTLANAFISYQGIYVLRALKDCVTIFGHAKVNRHILVDEVKRVMGWAEIVSRNGLMALDSHLQDAEPDDHLLKYGIDLVLKDYKPDQVRELLSNTIESHFDRAHIRVDVLENMASNSPAFGMIGTLVGLVIMLEKLEENPEGIGLSLAIALLTTLYGVLAARLVFGPAGKKVLHREEIVRVRNYMMLELFVMLAEQRTPRYIRDRMGSFLEPALLHRVLHEPTEPEEPAEPAEPEEPEEP